MREGSAVAQINSSGQSVPHACVICAPTIELALSEAEKLAAAAVCSGVGARPCGKCRDCRKAAEHVHPDIITVSRLLDDKGRPKREIGVDQIRDVIADAQVLPNEAARKVYIIDRAETMNAAEQNAANGTIVTAPTCGSCGVLPAVLMYLQGKYHYSDLRMAHALGVAGIIGNLIRRNASISGAECGCQAEVGSACSMAAAAMCELMEFPIEQVEYAAEIAMEHHLGLTCDPICGLVQIPCIERNAVAAKRAIDSANLAHMLVGTRTISFDMVVRTMYETGISMNRAFRETSEGGLARLYSRRAGTALTRK